MRSSILLLVLSATILAGCSSAYKTGQTPDDVYFSPQRQRDEYVNVKERDDENRYLSTDEYANDDQYLQMKVHNRVQWSQFDDWYNYTPLYSYGGYSSWSWNNPWSPATFWNYYYNPYCSPVIVLPKTGTVYNHPRIFNLNTYNSSLLTSGYTNPKGESIYSGSYYNPAGSYGKPVRLVGINNSNNNSGAGNFLRNIFSGSSSGGSHSGSSGSGRVSGGSIGGGSGGGGGAPVRRF